MPDVQNRANTNKNKGALVLNWKLAPGHPQVASVTDRMLQYFDTLQQEGIIQGSRILLDLGGTDTYAIVESDVETLIDLIKDPSHRAFLLECQIALPEFTAHTTLGGTNGDAREILTTVADLQQQVSAARYEPAGAETTEAFRQYAYSGSGRWPVSV